ncbi:MAG: ABC transporter ATP-binding protein [Candidatus Tectimicrobiota bacterium]
MLLDVRDLHTSYGLSQVLFGVSLALQEGECVVLLGRNGVGKTTTLRSIMGLTTPRQGQVRYKGQNISGLPAYRIARLGIGFVPEDRRIFADLSVRENLEIGRKAPASPKAPVWNLARIYDLFPSLARLETRKGGHLSGGEQQMLTIGRTLMGNPDLLLLDEPSEGLAPLVVRNLGLQLQRLKAAGLTMLLCEQNLTFALALSDRAYVLERGQVRFSGTMADLHDNPALRYQYLGV